MKSHTIEKGFRTLKFSRLGVAILAGGTAVSALPTATLAQNLGIEEIVVTATKRATRLQDTPMSISAMTDDSLRAINADDFADYFQLIPGLTAIDAGPGSKRYALRGLQSAGEPQVGLYYDEIPIAGLPGEGNDTGDKQADYKLWDVERVEVLRGPQGTLYGNGSMGGTLRVITKKPVLDGYEAAVQGSFGDTKGGESSYGLNGMVNVPVVQDKMAVRVAAYYRHEGGWIDDLPRSDILIAQPDENNLNDEKTYGGRASVAVKPSETWTLTGQAYYQKTEVDGKTDLHPTFATPTNDYVQQAYVRLPIDDKARMFSLTSENDMGFANLLATVSYQKRNFAMNSDTTRFLVYPIFGCSEEGWNRTCGGPPIIPANSYGDEEADAWSSEVRLTSAGDGPFQWTVGGFWQDRDTYRRGQVSTVTPANDLYMVFDPATGDALNRLFARDNWNTFKQKAVFGEGTYSITEDLHVTAGLRWFDIKRTELQELIQGFFGETPGVLPLQEFSEDKVVKKFQISYDLDDDAMMYAVASQGFRAGGPNVPGGFDLDAPPYEADSIWNYELGWKLGFQDNRFIVNAALFHIKWSDLQGLITDETGAFEYIANFGSAESTGFELEFNANLTEGLDWYNNVSFADARLVGDQPQADLDINQGFDGDRLPGVPRWTAASTLAYSWPVGVDYTGSARVDYTFSSGRTSVFRDDSPIFIRTKDYALVNLNLGLAQGDAWTVSLGVNNVFNHFAVTSARIADEVPVLSAARPRTVTLTVGANF